MDGVLEFHAGRRVREHVAREGFRLEDFPTLLGAAGGPKWLVLYGLDRVLAPRVRAAAAASGRGVDLIGASIGAWRFAAWLHDDPVAALDRLFETYVDPEPFADPLASFEALFRHYLEALFGGAGAAELLACPDTRLHAIVTRFPDGPVPHLLQLGTAALRNAVSRERFLAAAERVVVGSAPLPAALSEAWPHRHLPLTADTLVPALLATAAVPGMIPPVRDLEAGSRAVDGGIVDYHFDGSQTAGGFVLYPHFRSTLTPGWFDKPFRGRQRPAAEIDDLLVICPSTEFVASLPQGRIPDRGDPRRLSGTACAESWRAAGEASKRLGDALEQILDSDAIPALISRT
jgi:hypothetical protein